MKILWKDLESFYRMIDCLVIASLLMTVLAVLLSICMVIHAASVLRRDDCRKSCVIMTDGTLTIKK